MPGSIPCFGGSRAKSRSSKRRPFRRTSISASKGVSVQTAHLRDGSGISYCYALAHPPNRIIARCWTRYAPTPRKSSQHLRLCFEPSRFAGRRRVRERRACIVAVLKARFLAITASWAAMASSTSDKASAMASCSSGWGVGSSTLRNAVLLIFFMLPLVPVAVSRSAWPACP